MPQNIPSVVARVCMQYSVPSQTNVLSFCAKRNLQHEVVWMLLYCLQCLSTIEESDLRLWTPDYRPPIIYANTILIYSIVTSKTSLTFSFVSIEALVPGRL